MTVSLLDNAGLEVLDDTAAVAHRAAELFASLAQETVKERGVFRVALSGGSTPRLLYRVLASEFRDSVPWKAIRFFFGDERWVPPTSPDSNFRLANDELFTPLGIDSSQVYPIPTQGLRPEVAAEQYEETLRAEFGTPMTTPGFDLIFLGMGEDGHTASCFPYTSAINERERLVDATWVPKLDATRVTLTPPMLTAASQVIFMIAGAGKAPVLREVIEGTFNPEMYPSQCLRESTGHVTWLVDREAAAMLTVTGQ